MTSIEGFKDFDPFGMGDKELGTPERPPPPIVGKVNHFSIELYWDEALTKCNAQVKKGDGRTKVCVQEADQIGSWGNIYTGYAKRHIVNGLDPWTTYMYRIRFMNHKGNSEWSAGTTVTTTKEPLTGEHLHKAVISQDVSGIESILEKNESLVDVNDKLGFSPLMQASQKGYLEILEVLVNHGADVKLKNDSGKDSMMMACFSGKLNIVKELRYYGASYTSRDKAGSTPVHWAVDGGNTELIEWILDDGADVNITDTTSRWSPLIRCASVHGKSPVGEVLLRHGADINQRDRDGKTALMIAVVNGHQPLVELLLKNNADLSVKTEFGKSAYDMATSMEKRRVVKTIEEHMEKMGIKY